MKQPPSGGCVLKHGFGEFRALIRWQPPSGGCVLKPYLDGIDTPYIEAAAFGRLCVETLIYSVKLIFNLAAAFGRLCVETLRACDMSPASLSSRLRAAVC